MKLLLLPHPELWKRENAFAKDSFPYTVAVGEFVGGRLNISIPTTVQVIFNRSGVTNPLNYCI